MIRKSKTISSLIALGVILAGCSTLKETLPGNYDKDIRNRCEQLGGKMKTSQDKHGDFVYCLFEDNTHCAASVVRSANCKPGRWPLKNK